MKKNIFFVSIAITYQWVRTARKKKQICNPTGIIEDDMRGKHLNRPHQYPQEIVDLIKAHIECFPTMESHYCRESSERLYLEEGLNISKMWRMLKSIMEKNHIKYEISLNFYRKIFNTEYNYGFFIPKKDR